MYFVTATDKFMSGWGTAKGKINKYVIICMTYEEAQYAEGKLLNRSEMKYVNICTRKPNYNKDRYLVSWADRTNAPFYFAQG